MLPKRVFQGFAAVILLSVAGWAFYEGPDPEFHSQLLNEADLVNASETAGESARPAFELADDRTSPELADPVALVARDEETGESEPIDIGRLSRIAHAGPTVADIDGDGDRDLLVGDFPGYFWHFDNIGTNAAPEYQSLGQLQAGGIAAKTPVY